MNRWAILNRPLHGLGEAYFCEAISKFRALVTINELETRNPKLVTFHDELETRNPKLVPLHDELETRNS